MVKWPKNYQNEQKWPKLPKNVSKSIQNGEYRRKIGEKVRKNGMDGRNRSRNGEISIFC